MNPMLEKREKINMGDKSRGEIRSEIGKVKRVVADVSIMDSL